MINKRQLSTEELREKFLYLTQTESKSNLNESVVTSNKTSKLLKYETMADGKVYGIVQEGQKFFVKVCSMPKNDVLNVSDFAYIGGSFGTDRIYERFESYNKALNRLNGKRISLNETFGRLNESKDKDDLDEDEKGDVVNADKDSKKRSIKVTFDNGDTINTEINGTEETIKKYYIGKTFNLGTDEDEKKTKAVKVEFLGEVNEGEVNEEIPLNKDVDAKKGETIVPAPDETTPAPVETPVAEPKAEVPAAPVSTETPAPADATEPEAVDNTDIADYNPENPTPTETPAPSADASTDATATDAPADNAGDTSTDSNTGDSEDTVSEIQSLLGKLGAEFRKLPEVDATTAKSAINNIISSTKSGIEKLDDKDKEEIKKRIDKNGEKIDEETEKQLNEMVKTPYGKFLVKKLIKEEFEKYSENDSDEICEECNEEVESTDDELDVDTINEITELCGIDSKEVEEKLNEAIKTPYGKYLVKKLIKEEMDRYQSDDIVAENDDKKEVEGGYYRFNPSTKTFQTTMVNKENEPYPGEEFDKEDDAINHLKNSVTETVQESKYQKYLAAKNSKLSESDDSNPDIEVEYKKEEYKNLPEEIVELIKKGDELVRIYKNSKKEHYYPMIIKIVKKLRDLGHNDKAKVLLQKANQAVPKA